MAIAGGNITLDSTEGMDKISQTDKVTSPYFSDGTTELLAANIVSSSLTDTNENYFFGISHKDTATTEEFNVTFGSTNGYGADTDAGNLKSKTEAIYKQYANMLLPANEVTGGFFIANNDSLTSAPSSTAIASNAKDSEIYVLSARRSNMKDRINKKNWTIQLSGSNTAELTSAPILHLTDDSVNDTPTASPYGDRYNIVSGTNGTVTEAASVRTYGFFYPDPGIMVFSAAQLSASIPGSGSGLTVSVPPGETVIYKDKKHTGFAWPTTSNDTANRKTALRFINCLVGDASGKLKFRDEEDQVSVQYFCRIKAGHMNFSNNPTFVSGSNNELRHTTMKGNPTVYVNQLQLFNTSGDVVATANLSTPLKKNFSSEATIKVKLTY